MENLDAVNRKVMALENQLTNVTRQFEIQNRISNCALHDFEKLKNEFEILTCDFQSFKGSKGNAEEDQSNYSDCEIDENDMDCVEEIKWLKERMLEFSESLKFQSECLKNLQCMEIPQMQNSLDGKLESLEKSVDALNKKQNKRSDAQKGSEMKEIKAQLECFKCQISCIRNQMEDFQKHLVENQDMTCEELSALRQELMEKIQNNFSQISMKATSNHISTQNDQNSLPDLSNTSQPSKDENDEGVSDSKTYENEKSDNSLTKTIVNSINQRLCEIQKQVMSQSVCMQQLVRDLSCKVDRHEFECHIRKINDTIDALVQLKHDIQTAGTNAAGVCLPMSCISCQAPTNMSSGPSNIPKLPPLRYGRENILGGCSQNELNCSYSDAQRSLQSSNWNCYNFKPEPRKAGGYNTKVNRSMLVNGMRFRRLRTPNYATRHLNCFKTDFKRKSNIF